MSNSYECFITDLKQNHIYVANASFLVQLGEKADKYLIYLCVNDSEERKEDLHQVAKRLILRTLLGYGCVFGARKDM